jgi:hypothetical protein
MAKTDGALDKVNYGQQLTVGRFSFDFFNRESSATATADYNDRVYWTETSNSADLRGSNFYRCHDVPGNITAMRAIGGRLVVFKQRGMWVFQGTDNADIPIRLEKFYSTVGCNGTAAVDSMDDLLVFAGEQEIYSWTPGTDPKPLAGARCGSPWA